MAEDGTPQNLPVSDDMTAAAALGQLSERQQQVVALLLEGWSQTKVAREVGINRVTVAGWLKQAPVKRALAMGQAELAASRMDRLRRGLDLAIGHFTEVLEQGPPEGAEADVVVAYVEAQVKAAAALLSRVKPFALADLDGSSGAAVMSDEDWSNRYVTPDRAFIPHARQLEAIKAIERFLVLVAGVQSGKTTGAAVAFWRRIMEWVKSHELGDRGFFWMIAPNSIVGEVMCERFEELAPPHWIVHRSGQKGDRTWTLRDGSRVQFRSGEHADKLVARTVHGAWLDEFTLMKADAWLTSVRSRLAATGGWCIFSGTPRGRNWAWEHIWRRTIEGDDQYDPSWRGFTWHSVENPAVSKAEVDEARRQLPPAYFKREWEASWDAFHGQVYEGWGDHLLCDPMAPPLPTGTVIVIGVDWGFAAPGAAVVLRKFPGGVWEAIDEVLEAGKLPAWWTAKIIELWQRHRAHRIWCDPEDPARIATLVDEGLPAISANNDVGRGIREVAALVTQAAFRVSRRLSKLIGQMASYHWKRDTRGNAQEEPVKENDHLCLRGDQEILVRGFGWSRLDGLAVSAGREVWTPLGWSPFAGPWLTRPSARMLVVRLADGSTIVGTPDHLVLTAAYQYAPIESLRPGDWLARSGDGPGEGEGLPAVEARVGVSVQRASLLQVRALLEPAAAGRRAGVSASGRLDAEAWADPEGDGHPPRGRGPGQQRAEEPEGEAEGPAPARAHDAGTPRGGTAQHADEGSPGGRGVARERSGPGLPRAARAGGLGDESASDLHLSGVREVVRVPEPVESSGPALLPSELQDAGLSSVAEGTGTGCARACGWHAVSVASVEEVTPADAWDITVPGVGCFVLRSGVVSHNCDAARYGIHSENERALSPAVRVGWGGRVLGPVSRPAAP